MKTLKLASLPLARLLFPIVALVTTVALFFTNVAAAAATRGVTDDTISIGTHSDLSGPVSIWGVPWTNGMRMRFDEINAEGGVHGRQIRLLVEDHSYQVPLAVKAANKLINRDRVFAMLGNLGTPQNHATLPMQDRFKVPNLFPATGALTMYEPLHPMHFGYFVSYKDQVRGGLLHFNEQSELSNICLQAQATDYGQEIEAGVRETAGQLGLSIAAVGHHKPTETDFVGAATRIKNSDCELLVLGTMVKDTIQLYATLRKMGWDKPMFATMVPYLPMVAKASDGAMEGLYLVNSARRADFANTEDPWIKNFYQTYKNRFGKEPAIQAQIGYVTADLFYLAAQNSGRDLTVDKLLENLEGIKGYQDPFGGPSLTFGADKHHGADNLLLYQVQGQAWVEVKDNIRY